MIGLREDQQVKVQLVARINQLFPVAVNGAVVASGLAPRWAAQQPQSIGMRSIRHSSAAGSGAAAQPNAGQARSPQQARLPQ